MKTEYETEGQKQDAEHDADLHGHQTNPGLR
jgi:hypothetical protein